MWFVISDIYVNITQCGVIFSSEYVSCESGIFWIVDIGRNASSSRREGVDSAAILANIVSMYSLSDDGL